MGITAQATTSALPDAEVEKLIARADRFFDLECGVVPGYFEAAGTTASDRVYYGTGTRYLRVSPYVPGSLNPTITVPIGYLVPNFVELGDPPEQHLVTTLSNGVFTNLSPRIPYCGWQQGVPFTISAKWGFEATPEDVKLASIELSVNLWRELDPANVKLVSLEGQPLREKIPPRVNEIARRYRTKTAGVLV